MKGGIAVIDGQIAAWPGRNSWELRDIKKAFCTQLSLDLGKEGRVFAGS